MAQKIPYVKVFKEEGLIESAPHIYTVQYQLSEILPSVIDEYDHLLIRKQIEQLLNFFPEDVRFQFVTFAAPIEMKQYLSNVLIAPTYDNPNLNDYIEKHNRLITENVNVGHNNMQKKQYLILTIKKTLPEEALQIFNSLENELKNRIFQIYGITARRLSTVERLEIIYQMLNPNKNQFGEKANIDGTGFSFENLKYMRLTTKDIVAPDFFDTKNNDYLVLNKSTYVRSFFINSIPRILSSNFISDLTSVSSRMIYSTHYETVNSEMGFEIATELQSKNTMISEVTNRNSVNDRRKKVTIEKVEQKEKNEDAYFVKAALDLFKESVALGHNTLICSMLVVIYADSIEDLDRDSKLLKLSASKFACTIKCLDTKQLQGFQSALPLGNCKVDVKRTFSITKVASAMPPICVQDSLQAHGKFCGLNSINDNLIFINRRNGNNLNGLISGVHYSGKTFQNKREIFNAALNPNEEIIIISTSPKEYSDFINKLSGVSISTDDINIFDIYSEYALMDNPKVFKSYFLEALFSTIYKTELNNEDITIMIPRIEEEVALFIEYLTSQINISQDECFAHLRTNYEKYPTISNIVNNYFSNYRSGVKDTSTNRIKLYAAQNAVDMIVLLEKAWNTVISNKKKGKSTSIFIDSVDLLLCMNPSSDYLIEYMNYCNEIKCVTTIVINNAAKLITSDESLFNFEEVVNSIGYFKLLNQGPIERKKYIELLNIPTSLTNYISNTEPGEGLIITPYTNIAFDDSFAPEGNDFYELFKKEVVQYGT